jgi:Fe2+ transport system protein FeoA
VWSLGIQEVVVFMKPHQNPVASHTTHLTLASVPVGTLCQIVSILNSEAELTLLRFGLGLGDTLTVISKVPNKGPIICEAHDMEFALGFDYASSIAVERRHV